MTDVDPVLDARRHIRAQCNVPEMKKPCDFLLLSNAG